MRNIALALLVLLLALTGCSESDDADDQKAPDGDSDLQIDGDNVDSDGDDVTDGDAEQTENIEDDLDTTPEFLPADQPGPYFPAGFRTTFIDPDRDRELPGTIWYPTEAREGDKLYYQDVMPLGQAITGVEIAEGGPFELIMFSHGHQSFDAQSYFLTEHLASHGYIVAACDHIEDTTGTADDIYLVKSVMDRPQDIGLMIDTLLELNNQAGHILYGKINPDAIGVTGHSFGGYTSVASLGPEVDIDDFMRRCDEIGEENWEGEWRFCDDIQEADLSYADSCSPCSFGDDRIIAAIPMAPAGLRAFLPGEVGKIDVPLLIMAGELDTTAPAISEVLPFFEESTHPESIYWELAGAGHFAFSNMCEIISMPDYGCGDEFIDVELALGLINTASLAFFNVHLRDDQRYRRYFEDEYLQTVPEVSIRKKTVSE